MADSLLGSGLRQKMLLGLSSDSREVLAGLDVHKETIAVAIADSGRDGEVRYWGTMPNTIPHLGQLVTKLSKKDSHLEFTYEAVPALRRRHLQAPQGQGLCLSGHRPFAYSQESRRQNQE